VGKVRVKPRGRLRVYFVCFSHICGWGTQFDPVEQANNMHSHSQELKSRFGLSSERAVAEGKLLQISKGKSEPYNKELEGQNLQPELNLQKH